MNNSITIQDILREAVIGFKYLLRPKPNQFRESDGTWRGVEQVYIQKSAESPEKWIAMCSPHSGYGKYLFRISQNSQKYQWSNKLGFFLGASGAGAEGETHLLTLEEILPEVMNLASQCNKLMIPIGPLEDLNSPWAESAYFPGIAAAQHLEFKQNKILNGVNFKLERKDYQMPISVLADNPFNAQPDASDDEKFVDSWRCLKNLWELRSEPSGTMTTSGTSIGEKILIKKSPDQDFFWVDTKHVFRSGPPSYTIAPDGTESLFSLPDVLAYLKSIEAEPGGKLKGP